MVVVVVVRGHHLIMKVTPTIYITLCFLEERNSPSSPKASTPWKRYKWAVGLNRNPADDYITYTLCDEKKMSQFRKKKK
jgi:hypothetical protein